MQSTECPPHETSESPRSNAHIRIVRNKVHGTTSARRHIQNPRTAALKIGDVRWSELQGGVPIQIQGGLHIQDEHCSGGGGRIRILDRVAGGCRKDKSPTCSTSIGRGERTHHHHRILHQHRTAQCGLETLHSKLCTALASVAGLAPARTSLKGWLRELLCIHEQKGVGLKRLKWPPRLVSRQRLLLFREALICLSYSGGEVRLPQIGRPAR